MTPQPDKPIDCPAHPAVNDDLTLIKYELGIKEQRNGERDRQIKYAWNRINGIGKKTEQEDNTLREDIDDVKEDVNTIKGELKYISWFVKLITLLFLIYIAYFIVKNIHLGIL